MVRQKKELMPHKYRPPVDVPDNVKRFVVPVFLQFVNWLEEKPEDPDHPKREDESHLFAFVVDMSNKKMFSFCAVAAAEAHYAKFLKSKYHDSVRTAIIHRYKLSGRFCYSFMGIKYNEGDEEHDVNKYGPA